MELSKKERLFLFNQYLILEKLYPEDPSLWKEQQTIVLQGFESDYDALTYSMIDISAEICNEVIDILQMFHSLHGSYECLEDKSGIEENDLMFDGFDGNEEPDHYIYVQFVIEEQKLFEEFSKVELNSHAHRLNGYRQKLSRWREYGRYDTLTKEQIQSIIS